MSLLTPPQSNKWRNVERVAILKHKIAELDRYSITPIPDKILLFFGCASIPFATNFDTVQLQYILMLEKELDDELSQPLKSTEHDQDQTKDFRAILELRKKISKIDEETDKIYSPEDINICCGSSYSVTSGSNHLLLKQILERRLKRETMKGNPNGIYTYGSIASPTTYTESSENQQQQTQIKLEKWKRVLAKLKTADASLTWNNDEGDVNKYLISTYNNIKRQDLKNRIKGALNNSQRNQVIAKNNTRLDKNNNSPPPPYVE